MQFLDPPYVTSRSDATFFDGQAHAPNRHDVYPVLAAIAQVFYLQYRNCEESRPRV